jgi:hypothetical protein
MGSLSGINQYASLLDGSSYGLVNRSLEPCLHQGLTHSDADKPSTEAATERHEDAALEAPNKGGHYSQRHEEGTQGNCPTPLGWMHVKVLRALWMRRHRHPCLTADSLACPSDSSPREVAEGLGRFRLWAIDRICRAADGSLPAVRPRPHLPTPVGTLERLLARSCARATFASIPWRYGLPLAPPHPSQRSSGRTPSSVGQARRP